MSGFYHTCPNCGANLDPGERCDCESNEIPVSIGDCIRVTYDSCASNDHVVLTIARIYGNYIDVINTFVDDEAREMYSKLITQAPEGKIKILK